MALSKTQVIEQLTKVTLAGDTRDLVRGDRVRNVAVCDGIVGITIEVPEDKTDQQGDLKSQVVEAVKGLGEIVEMVNVTFIAPKPAGEGNEAKNTAGPGGGQGASGGGAGGAGGGNAQAAGGGPGGAAGGAGGGQMSPQQTARQNNALPGVKHIIAVGAGKGGVGKSTISVNLAVGLARKGLKVGLLDGDIYGPSVPTLLNLHDEKVYGTGNTLTPFEVHGIKTMTLGKLVDPNKPLIWRGPMAHGAFQQLALQTDWGELDYLIVDLPPGTGDVPLTLAQMVPLTGAIVVCTPQRVAQDDAVRAVGMFKQLEIDVLGVVENMSYFVGDDGKEYDLFGKGGAAEMAKTLSLPLLGQIPISMSLRQNSDSGNPSANYELDDSLTGELNEFVTAAMKRVEEHDANTTQTTLNIS